MADDKHSRTIRIDSFVYDRLMLVCKHQGVTPNAYILAKIGEGVTRDMVPISAAQSTSQLSELMSGLPPEVSQLIQE